MSVLSDDGGTELICQDLLKRYNPLHDMSDDERIRATARRVGLDAPTEYKPPDQ